MTTKETSFTFCSELPPGTYAGVVVKEELAEPPTICLYHEQGVKYTDSKKFYKNLWDRGFRYFKYYGRGVIFEISPP